MLRWWRWRLRLTWTFFLDLSVQEKKAQTREHVQQMPPRFKIQMWASDSAELNYTCKCRFEKSATVAVTLLLRQWRQTWCLPWWITYNAGLKSLTVYFRSTVKWTETAGCQEERENTLKRNYSMLWRMVSSNDLWFLICVNKSCLLTQIVLVLKDLSMNYTGLCSDWQPKSIFWPIQMLSRLILGSLDSNICFGFFLQIRCQWFEMPFKSDLCGRVSACMLWTLIGFQSVVGVTRSGKHNSDVKLKCIRVAERNPCCEQQSSMKQQSAESRWNVSSATWQRDCLEGTMIDLHFSCLRVEKLRQRRVRWITATLLPQQPMQTCWHCLGT